jgi:hypothetical protein
MIFFQNHRALLYLLLTIASPEGGNTSILKVATALESLKEETGSINILYPTLSTVMESVFFTPSKSTENRPAESVNTPFFDNLKTTDAKGIGSSLCLSFTTPDNLLFCAGNMIEHRIRMKSKKPDFIFNTIWPKITDVSVFWAYNKVNTR